MTERNVQRWQQSAAAILEPGERVRAAATGTKSGSIWVLLLWPFDALDGPLGFISDAVNGAVYAALKLGRVYLVTDRNVYVGRLSSWKAHKTNDAIVEQIDEVLDKRPLHDATVTFRRGRLRLNDANPVSVGRLGPGKRWAQEVVVAAAPETPPREGFSYAM